MAFRNAVLVLMCLGLLLLTRADNIVGPVACCSESADTAECVSLDFGEAMPVSMTWNGGTVTRWLGLSPCRTRAITLPAALTESAAVLIAAAVPVAGMPRPRVRVAVCPPSSRVFAAVMSASSGCEVAFDAVRSPLQRTSANSLRVVYGRVGDSQEIPSELQVDIVCGARTGVGSMIASVGQPRQVNVTVPHPDACDDDGGSDEPSVSIGDFFLGIGGMVLALVITYHVSVNAFVHERRGVYLLEPLPSLCRRVLRWMGFGKKRTAARDRASLASSPAEPSPQVSLPADRTDVQDGAATP